MRSPLPLTIFLLCLTIAHAESQGFPVPQQEDVPSWTFEERQQYKDKQLYGAIDGGAEQYFEYGFQEAEFLTMKHEACTVMVEMYHMRSPEAAFGIFSVSRAACPRQLPQVTWSCLGTENVSFARGEYYVSITGTVRYGSPDCEVIAASIVKNIAQPDFELRDIPAAWRTAETRQSMRCITGPLSLLNNKAEWADYLDGVNHFTLYAFSITIEHIPMEAGVLCFGSADDRRVFLRRRGVESNPVDKTWHSMPLGNRSAGYFLDGPTKLFWLEASVPVEVLSAKLGTRQ